MELTDLFIRAMAVGVEKPSTDIQGPGPFPRHCTNNGGPPLIWFVYPGEQSKQGISFHFFLSRILKNKHAPRIHNGSTPI